MGFFDQTLERIVKDIDGFRGSAVERWFPAVDISEDDDQYLISAEVPGMDKDNITVEIKEKTLTIKGEKKTEEKKEGRKYHRVETHYGSFERSFYLPDNIDEESVKASFKNGVLKLSIPKVKEESAVKKVDIAEE